MNCLNTFISHREITLKWTKIIISGPPGSGKSSTIKLLLDEDADKLHTSTPVLKTFLAKNQDGKWHKVSSFEQVISPILRSPLSLDSLDDYLDDSDDEDDFDGEPNHFIYGIDTGGQAAFYDIAPAIIRYDSVNLITSKLNEPLQGETSFFYSFEGKHVGLPIIRKLTNEQVLDLSFRSITSVDMQELDLEGIESFTQRYGDKPNILVLGTFHDEAKDEDIQSKNKFLCTRLEKFQKDASFLIQEKNQPLFTINAVSRLDIERQKADLIRNKICNTFIEATIPERWFAFLNSLQESEEGIVDIGICQKIGAEWEMTFDEVNSALKFYHNLTIILYFPEIPNIVFLNPQLLFDKLTELISISFADHANYIELQRKIDLPINAHDDLKEKGIFKRNLLEVIIDNRCRFDEFLDEFLKLLETLNIVVKIPPTGSGGVGTNTYFLPCVLAATEKLDQCKKFSQNVDPLLLWWEGKIIPQGLFCALVLHLLKEEDFDISGFCTQSCKRYRNAIQLPCRNKGMVLLVDSVEYLEIYYDGATSNCYGLREVILTQLSKAVRNFHYNPILAKPEKCFLRKCCHCVSDCKGECNHECLCVLSRDGKSLTCTECTEKSFSLDPLRQSPWIINESYSLLDEEPSLQELTEYVRVTLLQELATVLGITNEEWTQINSNNNNNTFDTLDKHERLFKLWLSKGHKLTRRHVVLALATIKEKSIARKYRDRILKQDLEITAQEMNDQNFNLTTVCKVLLQNNFDTHQWFELGESLELSNASLEEIGDNYDSSSRCLKECLSLWIDQGQGNPTRTWSTLAVALVLIDDKITASYIQNNLQQS